MLRLLGWGRAARKAAELEQAQQQQQLGAGQPGGRPLLPPSPMQQQAQSPEAMPAPVVASRPAGGGVGFDAAWAGGGSR